MHESVVIRLVDLKVLLHLRRHCLIDNFVNEWARLFRINRLVAISVNDFTLHVHHVVEIESPFPDQIIPLLYALLRSLDRSVQPWMLELLAFFQTEALHDPRHAISRAKVAHEIVFETDIESR